MNIINNSNKKKDFLWFGFNFELLSNDFKSRVKEEFNFVNCQGDPRYLEHCLFCYIAIGFDRKDNSHLVINAIRLCERLNKKFIIISVNSDAAISTENDDYINSALKGHHVIHSDGDEPIEWLNQLEENQPLPDYLVSEVDISTQSVAANDNKIVHLTSSLNAIRPALDYIANNMSKTIKEEELASYCHYSVTYFSRLFRRLMGESCWSYIMNERVKLACRLLLKDRQVKIISVAYQCGFKDVSYFSRVFKKHMSLSPTAYRRCHH
jgi:AraC-like DNA-binding protein